jgi:hypothetical protein
MDLKGSGSNTIKLFAWNRSGGTEKIIETPQSEKFVPRPGIEPSTSRRQV